MNRKVSFLKEKIIYSSIAILAVLISTITISHSLINNNKVVNTKTNYNIPVLNHKPTGKYHINGNSSYDKIDAILTGADTMTTTCNFDIFFVFDDDNSYVASDDNLINIMGYDNDDEIINLNLESVNKNNYQNIGSYKIESSNGKTVTKNLVFYVSSNNENNLYEGHIELRNVICENK